MVNRTLIPASGVMHFKLDNSAENLLIDGQCPELIEWRRPVIGLLFEPPVKHVEHTDGSSAYYYGRDPLEVVEGCPLSKFELVVDEFGLVRTPEDYISDVLGQHLWDQIEWLWQPHVSGPVTDGPQLVQIRERWETVEVCPCPTCEVVESDSVADDHLAGRCDHFAEPRTRTPGCRDCMAEGKQCIACEAADIY